MHCEWSFQWEDQLLCVGNCPLPLQLPEGIYAEFPNVNFYWPIGGFQTYPYVMCHGQIRRDSYGAWSPQHHEWDSQIHGPMKAFLNGRDDNPLLGKHTKTSKTICFDHVTNIWCVSNQDICRGANQSEALQILSIGTFGTKISIVKRTGDPCFASFANCGKKTLGGILQQEKGPVLQIPSSQNHPNIGLAWNSNHRPVPFFSKMFSSETSSRNSWKSKLNMEVQTQHRHRRLVQMTQL